MSQEEALKILIQVAETACKAGVFSLKDAKLVSQAVEVFIQPQEMPQEEVKKEVVKKGK